MAGFPADEEPDLVPFESEPHHKAESTEYPRWWENDKKMGAITTTVLFFCVLAVIVGLTLWFLIWLFTG